MTLKERSAKMRLLASVFVTAMLAATQASAKPEAIEFSDLVDPLAVVFDDPYRDMGSHLLNELKLLVELDEKLSENDLTEDERALLKERRSAAKDMLEINGQDVDALLTQRWDVAKKRQNARMATNPVLDGAEVVLSGYLIPAPQAADGSYFGYLVPQVGMCSHLPPPPPNQLVRVKLLDDPKGQSLYVPVRVSGRLSVEASDDTIFILDGESRMLSGWTLYANTIDQQEVSGGNGVNGASAKTVTTGAERWHADNLQL
ncbi:DUF3299 domain-containing protein [Alkalimarinus sediminis]|uniref:DUF3299 domain-containing protein n=1 Tax=Alkalimarinus sediminis TaxID=1632866 RepID=A0A9E8KP17_9ALTE|nr:DUF3299 domain-containing protein [Alkalimarinus sediminis]UZW74269.1 DUF3299 domain-containing protein [Alkalimarinus sediminis]